MTLTHAYEEMTPEKRPQDPHMDGTGLRFKTLDHGGEYPDTMPQAIKLTDAQGRSCIYVPITQNGKVVNSQGFVFDPEDERPCAADRGSSQCNNTPSDRPGLIRRTPPFQSVITSRTHP